MNKDELFEHVMNEAVGRDEYTFRHKEKFGKEKFVCGENIDITGIEDEEEVLRKIVNGFFRFLTECGWDSEFVLYIVMDLLEDAEEFLVQNNIEEQNPLTKDDEEFMVFIKKIGTGDPIFLKELYSLYKGTISLS